MARDRDRDDWRTFRVDRMQAAVLTGHRFTHAEEPDAEAMVAEGLAVASYPVQARVVLLRATLTRRPPRSRAPSARLESHEDGTLLRIGAPDVEWLARYLAGLPFPFRGARPARAADRAAIPGPAPGPPAPLTVDAAVGCAGGPQARPTATGSPAALHASKPPSRSDTSVNPWPQSALARDARAVAAGADHDGGGVRGRARRAGRVSWARGMTTAPAMAPSRASPGLRTSTTWRSASCSAPRPPARRR